MGFAQRSAVLLLLVAFVAADASLLERLLEEAEKRDYPSYEYEPSKTVNALQEMYPKLNKIQVSASKVAEQVVGFNRQFSTFFEHLVEEYGDAFKGYAKVAHGLIQAAPAEDVKKFAIGVLKTTNKAMMDISAIYRDYNPLHPKKSDHPGLFRRTAATLGTFGSALNELLTDADDLIVHVMDNIFISMMEENEQQFTMVLKQLEMMDADMVKMMVLQGTKM